jgi:hypothetical protein
MIKEDPTMKSGIELLAEACKTDFSMSDSMDTSSVIAEANEVLTSTMDIEEEIPMTPEMIPVIQKGDKYYVDFSSVFAAANDMGADIGAIMNQIMDVNSDGENTLTPKNLILTVESADYFDELIQEAKKGGSLGDKAKDLLKNATDTIKNMKKAGIKVGKKKSKKKKC